MIADIGLVRSLITMTDKKELIWKEVPIEENTFMMGTDKFRKRTFVTNNIEVTFVEVVEYKTKFPLCPFLSKIKQERENKTLGVGILVDLLFKSITSQS